MTATQTYTFDNKTEQAMILRFRRMTASEAENWKVTETPNTISFTKVYQCHLANPFERKEVSDNDQR